MREGGMLIYLIISNDFHSHIGTPMKTMIYLGHYGMVPNLSGGRTYDGKRDEMTVSHHGKQT
jgi:hypothetical protein